MSGIPQRIDRLLCEERVRVVDVGARGGLPPKWHRLRPWISSIGFEPEPAEYERLRSKATNNEIYIQEALYRDRAEVVLHHTRDPNCSSLYPPNQRLIRRLRPDDDRMDVMKVESISATTLDQALQGTGSPSVHFIKLDTQGSELDILTGGNQTLAGDVVGVEVEVEFLPLYEGQPLFADVHQFLVNRNFVVMGFPHTCNLAQFRTAPRMADARTISKRLSRLARALVPPYGTLRGAKQLLYADAIYLRDIDDQVGMIGSAVRPDVVAARAVAVSCATGYYEHALTLIDAARGAEVIGDHLRDDLFQTIQTFSRSLPTLLADLRLAARRLRDRMWHLEEQTGHD